MRRLTAGAETDGRTGRARKRHGGERLGVEAADVPLFEDLRALRHLPRRLADIANELAGKQLDILRELVPEATAFGYLVIRALRQPRI
jgi:hypothetical protein